MSYDNRFTARIEPEAARLIGDLERESGVSKERGMEKEFAAANSWRAGKPTQLVVCPLF